MILTNQAFTCVAELLHFAIESSAGKDVENPQKSSSQNIQWLGEALKDIAGSDKQVRIS